MPHLPPRVPHLPHLVHQCLTSVPHIGMYVDRFQTGPLLPPPPSSRGESSGFSGDLKIPVKTQEFRSRMLQNRCSPLLPLMLPPRGGGSTRGGCSPSDRFKRRRFLVKLPPVPPPRGGSVHLYRSAPACPTSSTGWRTTTLRVLKEQS